MPSPQKIADGAYGQAIDEEVRRIARKPGAHPET
ncbi:hypothetical protein HNO88_001635 [Novosphingobium chloroacetimidivorans]|uniref:Uncharacterized protein n=1 Tax=Novosphingobium chloroacetimidivorans TaxID=1428314 RepID=A0A7W7K9B8_9SPHN|nr:hypothetical protein [Novosphingobium chloroacetimidivorans]